jgi:hypothetical protein
VTLGQRPVVTSRFRRAPPAARIHVAHCRTAAPCYNARVLAHYAAVFWELLRTPFLHMELVWGIVPLYFAWLVQELMPEKANRRTALNTGFSLLWSGAHWTWQTLGKRAPRAPELTPDLLLAVNVAVTVAVMLTGLVALGCGLRRKFPRGAEFLGHARFANYFMIAIFAVQSRYLEWTWDRVIAIAGFAVPVWLLCHLAFRPLRQR